MTRRSTVFFFLLVGCAPLSSVDEQQAPIIGGNNDTSDPGVVLVMAGTPNSNYGSICTGSVVSPHVVLTAAHCVSESFVGRGSTFQVFLGSNIDRGGRASDFVAVKEVHPHPNYDSRSEDNDIGVVITSTAL